MIRANRFARIGLRIARATKCNTANLYHDTIPICIVMHLQKYKGQGSLEHSQLSGTVCQHSALKIEPHQKWGKLFYLQLELLFAYN